MPREKTKVSQKPRKRFPDWLIQESKRDKHRADTGGGDDGGNPADDHGAGNVAFVAARHLGRYPGRHRDGKQPGQAQSHDDENGGDGRDHNGVLKRDADQRAGLGGSHSQQRIDQCQAQDEKQGEGETFQFSPAAAAAHVAHDDGDDRVDTWRQAGQEAGRENQDEQQQGGLAELAADEIFQAARQRFVLVNDGWIGSAVEVGPDCDLDPALVRRIAQLFGIFLANLKRDIKIKLDGIFYGLQFFQKNADAELSLEDVFVAERNAGREYGFQHGGEIIFFEGNCEKIVFQIGDVIAGRDLEKEIDGYPPPARPGRQSAAAPLPGRRTGARAGSSNAKSRQTVNNIFFFMGFQW